MISSRSKATNGWASTRCRCCSASAQAARFACWVMAVPQVVVVALLLTWQLPYYAIAVGTLLVVQLFLMAHFLKSPRERAPWYNGTGISCYVVGMLISAFALAALRGG